MLCWKKNASIVIFPAYFLVNGRQKAHGGYDQRGCMLFILTTVLVPRISSAALLKTPCEDLRYLALF